MSETAVYEKGARTGVTSLFNKKTYLKIPAEMVMLRNDSGHISRFIFNVDILNYNINGVCISWNYCPLCYGYEPNRIHENCYFAPFSINNPQSGALHFNIEVPVAGDLFTFRGKAVYTYKSKKGEKIGIAFTDISSRTRNYLEHFFYRR